jgi:TonB family protein
MRLRSAVIVTAVGVLCGLVAVSARQDQSGRAGSPQEQVYDPGPGIVLPVIVRQREPQYTREAMREKIQGDVELEAVVGTDGTVGEIRVIKSLDQKYGLDDAAIGAAKQWIFRPGTKDGKPVNVRVILVLTFRLKTDSATAATPADLNNARALYGLLTGRSAVPVAGQMTDEDFSKGTYPEWTPDLVKPRVTFQLAPKYTSDAMRAKIQGDVVIDAVIAADGTVARARVVTSLDTQYGLDEEALKAVKQWTFEPGVLGGLKVPVLTRVTLTFRLH